MPSLIKSLKGNKLIDSSNIYDDGRLLNKVLENYRRIISQMPTVDGEGESITLNGCINAEFLKFELSGNTSQEEGTSPESPQEDIHVVKGHNAFKIANAGDTEFQTFPLDLPEGMEMCGMGDYADTFEKVGRKWYKKPEILKTNFNASTIISTTTKASNDSAFQFYFYDYCDLTYNNVLAKCTHYPSKIVFKQNSIWNNYQTDTMIVHTFDDVFTSEMTVAEARAKFHEIYDDKLVFYTKLTQTPIEITDPTLISQLEAIKRALSYAGTTIITQENEDLPFNISVSALKDLHTLEYANYLNE